MARAAMAAVIVVALAACQFQLGGPNNTFGNDPTRLGTQPGVWAAINGPFSDHADGDPYATECVAHAASATTCDASGTNPNYASSGYSWAVDVPAADVGIPVTVAVYDPAFGPNSTIGESYSDSLATGFATSYRLFETTGDANHISEDPSLGFDVVGACTGATPGYHVFAPGTTSQNAWYSLCTFTPTQAGIYPLQVRSSGIPGVTDSGGGINLFSVRATTSAPTQPAVYALNQLSFEASGSSGTARFYLANIGQQWAGHTMVVDLFDPGDGSGGSSNFVLQLLAPPGGVPSVVPTGGTPLGCSYSDPTVSIGGVATNVSATCSIVTKLAGSSTSLYNDRWLRIVIQLPSAYTCSTDCWWSVKYTFGTGVPTDRMVAQLNVSTAVTATTTTSTTAAG